MTPPPLDEKVKNHSQRFISKTNKPFSYPHILSNRDEIIFGFFFLTAGEYKR